MLAAAAAVARLSSGRVRTPEGLNRRTGKPEREGLFCARIFGPVDDLRCLCGKLVGPEFAGESCPKCGVLCGERRLRGERWGHIESPVGLVHPCLAPQIAAALRLSEKNLRAVLCCEAFLDEHGALVRDEEIADGRGPVTIERHLGDRAHELLIFRVPVMPPDWRGTRGDPQDEGYARLVNRCNRLARLGELNAPTILIDNEAYMTQLAFEGLLKAVRAELPTRGPVTIAPHTAERAALLQAVYDDPDDDAARRAYGESLQAAGDLRGDFILRQLASAARSRSPRIERDMLRRNLDRWLVPLQDAVEPRVEFRRGFLAECRTIKAGAIARVGDPAWATVEHLETDVVELITHPVMRSLRSLTVGWTTLRAVCESGALLPRVDTLLARIGRCPPPGAEAVMRGEALPSLRTLTLKVTSTRGGSDWTWFDGTELTHRLERFALHLPLEHLQGLSLQRWVDFLNGHPGIAGLTITIGIRMLQFELRRECGLPALRVLATRGWLERVMMGVGELAEGLGAALTAVDPCGLASVRIDSPGAWWGDELVALARTLRGHFGASALRATVHEE